MYGNERVHFGKFTRVTGPLELEGALSSFTLLPTGAFQYAGGSVSYERRLKGSLWGLVMVDVRGYRGCNDDFVRLERAEISRWAFFHLETVNSARESMRRVARLMIVPEAIAK